MTHRTPGTHKSVGVALFFDFVYYDNNNAKTFSNHVIG